MISVIVTTGNSEQAIRSLKQKMQRELVFSKMRTSRFFESCSKKKARKKQESFKRKVRARQLSKR